MRDDPDEFKGGQLWCPRQSGVVRCELFRPGEIGEVDLIPLGWLSSPRSFDDVRFTEVANDLLSRSSLG